MTPNIADGAKQDEIDRHIKGHCPEMGTVKFTDEALHLKVGQPVCLTFFIHHARGRKGQQSVGRVLKFGENEVIVRVFGGKK
jgi:hypothetical protein